MPTITSFDLVVQAVPALAVGVVGQDVEHRELAEAVLVAVEQREEVLVGVVLDELLHRALAERAVAQDRDRHDAPPERVRQLVRRDLAVAQRALGEVPQRPLAAPGLVDRLHLDPVDAWPRRGTSRSTSTACARRPRAPRPTSAAATSASEFSSTADSVPGRVHRLLAQRARRPAAGDGLGARGRPSRAPARGSRRCAPRSRRRRRRRQVGLDVALVVVVVVVLVGGALAQLDEHELALEVEAEADEPGAEQRHGRLAELRLGVGHRDRELREVVGDAVEEGDRFARRAARPAPSRPARSAGCPRCAPGCRTRAARARPPRRCRARRRRRAR